MTKKLIELVKECHQGTNLQRLTKCKSLIGSEIVMTYPLNNITAGLIFLALYEKGVTDYQYGNTFEEAYSIQLYLTYDGNIFDHELMRYSIGDLVTIRAKLKSVEMSYRLLITLEMLSIEK